MNRYNIFSLYLFFLISLFLTKDSRGQSTTVRLSGTVTDFEYQVAVPNLMVVNKTNQQGYFADLNGFFEITVDKFDTLIFASTGYSTLKFSLADSVTGNSFFVQIRMRKLEIQLREVEIFTRRDLNEIQKDIEKLGYDDKQYMLDGVDALSSPITALYQAFSRRERNKRLVAEMRNDDRRRALLKELFRKYVDNDIISLGNEEFDAFVDFCAVSDSFLKGSTQYDFIMYVKNRFEVYRMLRK